VDRPRQKLESLFLEIVHRAQAEGAATSGAVAGGRIAAFLMDHAGHSAAQEDPAAEARRLLETLTTTPQPADAESQTEPDSTATDQPHHDVLDELVTTDPQPPSRDRQPMAPSRPDPQSAEERTKQQVDRDLLDRLTRGDQE
jgi:hypothetical protein